MDFEKALKNAKWFAVGILVLSIISFVLKIISGAASPLIIILGLAQLIIIILAIKGFNDEQMYGPICGIIVSVLLILNLNIISIIFGILYLIDCIKIKKYM